MFPTEPKFVKITSERELVAQIKQYELKFNVESPRTQKALDSLSVTKESMKRKNKFQLRYELAFRKEDQPPPESRLFSRKERMEESKEELNQVYIAYLEALIQRYVLVLEERKRIKQKLSELQKKQDEYQQLQQTGHVKHNKSVASVSYKNLLEATKVPNVDDILQKIDKDASKEKKIANDCLKQRIADELEHRKYVESCRQVDDKVAGLRQKKQEERLKKTKSMNLQVEKVHNKHKEQENNTIKQQFVESQTFHQKLDQKELEHNQQVKLAKEHIKSRNGEVFEKFRKRKSLIGHDISSQEMDRRRKDAEVEFRQRLNEEMRAKQMQDKQMQYQQRLQSVNQENKKLKGEFEYETFNSYGSRMNRVQKQVERKSELLQKTSTDIATHMDKKVQIHKQLYSKERQKERGNQVELAERIKTKEESATKLRRKKIEELQDLMAQKEQMFRETLYQQEKRRNYQKMVDDDMAQQKWFRVQSQLQKKREDHDKLRLYSTFTKLQVGQHSAETEKELQQLKYQTSEQLREKLRELSDDTTTFDQVKPSLITLDKLDSQLKT